MKATNITLIKLEASEGMVLTNGDIYGKKIYLGCNDSADNYHEITDSEYAEILKEEERNEKD